jgi:hypothetical protein
METVCAWCRIDLSEAPESRSPVSHAICPACSDELEHAMRQSGLRISRSHARGQTQRVAGASS